MDELRLIEDVICKRVGIDYSDISIDYSRHTITYHYHTGDIVIRVSEGNQHTTVISKYDSEEMFCARVAIDDFSISADAITSAIEYLMYI